ncbi:BFD-like [2Fe-2S] binding domain protein [Ruminiclostridium hungatei]|uniref:BFD-like [2Fe-2S] binding domain protein n=1 Tax=Ruminiclostridium hungatei TaxID=48256 RepID=A0A1V4SLR5_RUMHU|nr:(2Fe-2S)-binding protein [Ruminiclostridium hungatei]OPX44425.1 BFD-like [2Fe-2S] binding domain protein [Ruminiclostridium hungatei]
MDNDINSEIMDKITKVCICKAISRAAIKKAIQDGAKTLLEVQQVTGAGSGPCGGRRCTLKILELLEIEGSRQQP